MNKHQRFLSIENNLIWDTGRSKIMAKYRNYLLFIPSLMTERSKMLTYSVKDWDTKYTGTQTNEALTKYLCDMLRRQGEKLEKIFMLCTPEVLMDPIQVAGGKTSYEYYRAQISKYMTENCGYTKDDIEGVFEKIAYAPVLNVSHEEITAPVAQVISYIISQKANEEGRLFVDFTGGTRNSAMALVFACRISQARGVEKVQVLYSNISRESENGMIEDCTGTYDAFSQMELKTRLELEDFEGAGKIVENTDVFTSEDKKILTARFKNEKDVRDKEILNDYKGANESARKIKKETQKTQSKVVSSIIEEALAKPVPNVKKEESNDLLKIRENLAVRKDVSRMLKAVGDFREKAVYILWQEKLIDVANQYKIKNKHSIVTSLNNYATNEILGAYRYYAGFKSAKRHEHGAWEAANELIQKMAKERDLPPETVYNEQKESTKRLMCEYFKEMDARGFEFFSQFNNGFAQNATSRKFSVPKIKEFLKSNDLVGDSFDQWIFAYGKAERLYTQFGYPLLCNYGGSMFEGYDDAYQKEMDELVSRLQSLYEQNVDSSTEKMLETCFEVEKGEAYASAILKIAERCQEGEVPQLLPFVIINKRIWRGVNAKGDWNTDMFYFARNLDIVRGLRNKIAHPKEMKMGEVNVAVESVQMTLDWIDRTYDGTQNCSESGRGQN